MEQKLRNIAGLVCRGEATKEQEAFIVASYAKVFGVNFSRCRCQLCDAVFLILNNLNRMERQYKLKKGIVLRLGAKRITHINITDDLAIELLKQQPLDIKYFDQFPKQEIKVNDDLAIALPTEAIHQSDDMAVVKPAVKKRVRRKK